MKKEQPDGTDLKSTCLIWQIQLQYWSVFRLYLISQNEKEIFMSLNKIEKFVKK